MSIAENQKELLEMASECQLSAVDQVLDFKYGFLQVKLLQNIFCIFTVNFIFHMEFIIEFILLR